MQNIQDLTRVIISYEIYETSLRHVSLISYGMTTSVRFCLSYDPFKCDFITFIMNIISIRKRFADTNIVSDVTESRQSLITRVGIRFFDMTLSTEYQRRHMINRIYEQRNVKDPFEEINPKYMALWHFTSAKRE